MPDVPVHPLLASTFTIVALASLALGGCVEEDATLAPPDEALAEVDDVPADAPNPPGSSARIVGAACPSLAPITSRTAPVRGTTTPGLPLPYPACQTPVVIALRSCANNPSCRDVRAFGATADDDVDDTAAIQRAIDAAPAGGVVYLPAGRYVIDQDVAAVHLRADRAIAQARFGLQLRGRRDLHLVGDGDDRTILEDHFSQDAFDAASAHDLAVFVGTIFVEGSADVTIGRLGLVSTGGFSCAMAPYAGRVDGIRAEATTRLTVTEVAARHYNSAGVSITDDAGVRSLDPKVANNLLQQNRVAGLLIGHTTGALIVHNRFYNNGRHGNGETAYGMAASAAEPPIDTTVRCNLADYNVRKGLDFHAALGQTRIVNNASIGSGVAGIFVSGSADRLGGTITIDQNRVATMSPAVTDAIHGLGASGTGAGVVGIWTYPKFTTASSTAPTIVIKNNTIEDFTAAGGTQSFAPFQLRAEAHSTGSTTVWNNVVKAGVVRQFIMTNTPATSGGQTFHVRGNTLSYERTASPAGVAAQPFIALSKASSVTVVGNTFTAAGAPATADQWDDAAIQRSGTCSLGLTQKVYGAAPTTCVVTGNRWVR
ncbi:MAG: right-handed parallel beta-helix repeat-containing protein [Myxococcales bacterium]|nr:right-handed parallel beta-helix repeat-containing protein [Myxococcales bacterium]MBK7192008.1 right-handed parallel beta-helix repeat-containing protein [Myxococcales bacterium]MBP6849538.1 right-handed parallel beta-helix repeat-containing protein [Kofleriaceae bacterium]